MTLARRKFHIELAMTFLVAAALVSAGLADDYWAMGFLAAGLILQFWKLHQLGQAAEEA